MAAIVAGIAIVLASNGSSLGLLAALAALVGAGVGLYDLVNASSKFAQAGGLAQVDWGLYATVIGGIACLAGIIAARDRLGRPRGEGPAQAAPLEDHPFA